MRRNANDPNCEQCGFDHAALDYVLCPRGQEWIEMGPNLCHQRVRGYQVCGLLESEAFASIYGKAPHIVANTECPCYLLADLVDLYVVTVHSSTDRIEMRERVKAHLLAGDRQFIRNLTNFRSLHANFGDHWHGRALDVFEHIKRPVYMGMAGWLTAAIAFAVGAYWTHVNLMITPEYMLMTVLRLLLNGPVWSEVYSLIASAALTAVSATALVALWRWCTEPHWIEATVRHRYRYTINPQNPGDLADQRPLKANYASLTVPPLELSLRYKQKIFNHMRLVVNGRHGNETTFHPTTPWLYQFYVRYMCCSRAGLAPKSVFSEGSRKLIPLVGPFADVEVIVNLVGNFAQQHDEQLSNVYERMKVTHRQLTQVNLNRFETLQKDTTINSLVLGFALLVEKRQSAGLDDYVIEPTGP